MSKSLKACAVAIVFLAFSSINVLCQEEPVKPQSAEGAAKQEQAPAPAVEEKEVTRVEAKEVEGVINAKSPTFIAIDFQGQKGLEEMAFRVAKELKFAHKKSYKEFAVGDTVTAQYAETTVSKGDKILSSSRVLKQLIFLKAAETAQQAAGGQLKSNPAEGEKIPLKGLKGD